MTVTKVTISLADPSRKVYNKNSVCASNENCGREGGETCRPQAHHHPNILSAEEALTALVTSREQPKNASLPRRMLNTIPPSILQDAGLNEAISALPANYNFEVHKCVWFIRRHGYKRVALQLPEGFQRYALALCDILRRWGALEEAPILADVAYGACCIDDWTARQLACDALIHYGHSCLIPVTVTQLPVLYVFVEIAIPVDHLARTIMANFRRGERLALMATVQYVPSLYHLKELIEKGPIKANGGEEKALDKDDKHDGLDSESVSAIRDPSEGRGLAPSLFIPQIRPLSPGEVLGCTAPRLPSDTDGLLFIADGRFHLEAAMLANPQIPAYRYDPYEQCLLKELYDHGTMRRERTQAIERARKATHWGLILGTLGRQGSVAVMEEVRKRLVGAGKRVTQLLMSEVRPETLRTFPYIEAWVQTSCPRLSIDWGYTFDAPVLTPYELNVLLGGAPSPWRSEKVLETGKIDDNVEVASDTVEGGREGTKHLSLGPAYPMDFYATGDAAHIPGPWTPGYHLRPPRNQNGGANLNMRTPG